MQKAQGAIEYLLLIAAAVMVVAVVISFLASSLDIWGKALDQETLDALCKPRGAGGIDQNSLLCGCYLKDSSRGETNSNGTITMASKENCPEKLPENYQTYPLLDWQ